MKSLLSAYACAGAGPKVHIINMLAVNFQMFFHMLLNKIKIKINGNMLYVSLVNKITEGQRGFKRACIT